MWDNYDEIKDDEAKLNAKLLKKSRAMQKAEKNRTRKHGDCSPLKLA